MTGDAIVDVQDDEGAGNGDAIPVVNPATGERVAEVAENGPADVAALVARARAAQPAWQALGFRGRAKVMRDLRHWVVENRESLFGIYASESGRIREDSLFVEFAYPCDSLAFWAKRASKYLRAERIRAHSPFVRGRKIHVHYEPRGVIGVIAPWNFPISIGIGDAIPALMAGNSVVLKPSEVTPLSALAFARGWEEIGAPAHVFAVATGGTETGRALVDQADMIQFTGSVATGREIAARAGRRLVPVSLELGGKDPMIVLEDADLDRAAGVAVRMGLLNSGQGCISVERIYAVESVYDEFVAKVVERAKAVRLGSFDEPGAAEIGPMIFPPQLEKVERHVRDALGKGARVLTGGRRREAPGQYYEPTVLVDVDHEMDVMREETFGPVLPIMRVRDESEALRLANDTSYGLDSSVFTRDLARGRRVAGQIKAGATCVNDAVTNLFVLEAPFGGMKESGIGGRGGPHGIRKYCDEHTVLVTTRIGAALDERAGWPNAAGRTRFAQRAMDWWWGPRRRRRRAD